MPRTDAQRIARTRHYLGYPDRFRDFASQRQVEQALAAIGAESLIIVDEILDSLALDDAALRDPTQARLRIQARKVGSIELPGGDEIGLLRSLGRQDVTRLSAILAIAPYCDVFSPSPPPTSAGGDNYLQNG